MIRKLFRPGAPFPTNKAEAIAYAEEMAHGLRLWIGIDIAIAFIVFGAWYYGSFNLIALLVAAAIALGCPAIVILGFSFGYLRYLTPKECYWIVRFNI